MDYLVIEGFKTAAEEFSKEAGLNAPVDLESIESRMDIREALQRGDVSEAITRVNDLNPEVRILIPLRFEARCKGGGRKGLNFFMHHSRVRLAVDETSHQNFSLQYDLSSHILFFLFPRRYS